MTHPEDSASGFTGDRNLGLRIRTLRKQVGISQEKLAHRLGVTQGTITFWETGRTSLTLTNLRGLATELGVKVGELLGADSDATMPLARIDRTRLCNVLQAVADADRRAFTRLPPQKQAHLIAHLYSVEVLPSKPELSSLIKLTEA